MYVCMHVCMKGDEQQKRGYVLTVKKPCKAVQKGNRTKHFFLVHKVQPVIQ